MCSKCKQSSMKGRAGDGAEKRGVSCFPICFLNFSPEFKKPCCCILLWLEEWLLGPREKSRGTLFRVDLWREKLISRSPRKYAMNRTSSILNFRGKFRDVLFQKCFVIVYWIVGNNIVVIFLPNKPENVFSSSFFPQFQEKSRRKSGCMISEKTKIFAPDLDKLIQFEITPR